MKLKRARLLPWLGVPLVLMLLGLVMSRYLETRFDQTDSTLPVENETKITRTLRHFDADETQRSMDRPGLLLRLIMPPDEATSFRESWHKRAEVEISFENGLPRQAIVRIRGKSSRTSLRKSFQVELAHPQRFADITLQKFFLLNMLSDSHNFEMAFSYRLLSELDLFPSYYQFARLYLNDDDEGLYLLVERPKDAIRRVWPDTEMIARPRLGPTQLLYAQPRPEPLHLLDRLEGVPEEMEGLEAYEAYERIVDLDNYLTWIAFNALIENGDSRNELYIYEVRSDIDETGRLRVAAWDYDDLQEPPIRPDDGVDDPLLYACEMPLDRQIPSNPDLYRRYKQVLRRLLTEELTEERLSRTLHDVRTTVEEIGSDRSPQERAEAQLKRFEAMQQFEQRLLERRRALLDELDR